MDPVAAVGRPAPDIALRDLDGKLLRLSDQLGRIQVLNFWSAECPYSHRLDDALRELRSRWADRVTVWWIAASDQEDEGRVRQAARERRLAPVLRDPGNAVADVFGARTTPHLFVIDEQGILRYAGAPDDVSLRQRIPTRSYMVDAVQALLEGREPEPNSTAPYGCAIVRTPAPGRSAARP